jgi:PAS domain S-box-containing protein
VLLALFQVGRVRLLRMRRETTMREALHEATRERERYRYVTDLVPDQIFTIGPDGRFDYMNERTVAFLGRGLDDSTRWLALHHPDDTLHVQVAWSNALHAGEPVEVESRMLGADSQYHWILTRAIPQHGEDGSIVRWFCSGTDITGRQRHEQALREARQRLAEAQAIAHIGSWSGTSAPTRCAGPTSCTAVRCGARRAAGLRVLPRPGPPRRPCASRSVIGAAVAERRSYEFATRVIRPDGEEREFFCGGQVLTGEDGQPTRLVGVAQDITERVRAERSGTGWRPSCIRHNAREYRPARRGRGARLQQPAVRDPELRRPGEGAGSRTHRCART